MAVNRATSRLAGTLVPALWFSHADAGMLIGTRGECPAAGMQGLVHMRPRQAWRRNDYSE